MPRIRRVCVIGAGLSGLACTLAIAATAGREVDVCSSAVPPLDDAAQVDLGPSALRALSMLGVAGAAAAAGFAYQGVGVVNERGEPLFEFATPQLAGRHLPAAMGVGHTALLDLMSVAAGERGARVHLGVRIEARSDGRAANDAAPTFDDERAASADLVVLAGGFESPLRRTLFHDAPPAEDFGEHWWQAILPRPFKLERATWVIGRDHARLLLLPVSVDHVGVAVSRPAAALDECEQGRSRAASLREAIAYAAPVLPSLHGHLRDDAAVSVRPVRAAMLPAPWHRGKLLCVGECAHALPPHFGQDVAQCLEDAVVLGELLREDTDRDQLLAGFSARRAGRASRVHAIVTQAARWSRRPDRRTDLLALAADLDSVVASAA